MESKLTKDQTYICERIYWLLLKDLLETSKSTQLDKLTNRVSKLSEGALEAATKIATENY